MAFSASPAIQSEAVRPRLNLHPLFFGARNAAGFLKNLDITPEQDRTLLDARKQIRRELRRLSAQPHSLGLDRNLVFDHRARSVRKRLDDTTFRPRFLTQGSYAYRTLNAPCRKGQSIDLDDGIYFPMSFIDTVNPELASRAVFELIERALESICRQNQWTIERKPTCVRIHLDAVRTIHIDLPIYAIPDIEFDRLEKALAQAFGTLQIAQMQMREAISGIDRSALIDSSRVMLAHRELGWIPSDPQRMNDWVKAQIALHGEGLRRVWRYLKAWRDFQWQDSKLASIHLMAAVSQLYDEHNDPSAPGPRDDLDVAFVAGRLVRIMARQVTNPVNPNQSFQPLVDDFGNDLLLRLDQLDVEMYAAIYETGHRGVAIRKLIAQFGNRVPKDETMVIGALSAPAPIPRSDLGTVAAMSAIPMVGKATAG
ncbi:CBASS cGAMP synthase [Thalassobaculum sp.]|uniref:CBASS cGAMP synthase n=1 Tax=Thalassobaculum sp. TaxID=2022740 RepID=UPI003B5CEB7A